MEYILGRIYEGIYKGMPEGTILFQFSGLRGEINHAIAFQRACHARFNEKLFNSVKPVQTCVVVFLISFTRSVSFLVRFPSSVISFPLGFVHLCQTKLTVRFFLNKWLIYFRSNVWRNSWSNPRKTHGETYEGFFGRKRKYSLDKYLKESLMEFLKENLNKFRQGSHNKILPNLWQLLSWKNESLYILLYELFDVNILSKITIKFVVISTTALQQNNLDLFKYMFKYICYIMHIKIPLKWSGFC